MVKDKQHNPPIEKQEKEKSLKNNDNNLKNNTIEKNTTKNEKPIPFFEHRNTTEIKKQKNYQFGILSFLIILALLIILSIFTPIYSVIIPLLPTSFHRFILSDFYQSVTLSDKEMTFNKPIKLPITKPLPVLGYDTGICFSFYSTMQAENRKYIDTVRIDKASHGGGIAEIIAIGQLDRYEYNLENTNVNQILDKNKKLITVICQKFGHKYASTPRNISALYIRPLKPFTAHKVIWSSTKHL